ncbi:uncharacterized protein LOC6564722 [Drosophila grimshawi]|uniref:GH12499 n=1 Tax=Drosophila grimshawi TaxID=7222 RepID=B4JJJ0_DROGR|nr:uncharacterized protein LOC6564722 [Drosophila grimshawi]EDV99742.1 GH12499 [Drosophila grimshawi]
MRSCMGFILVISAVVADVSKEVITTTASPDQRPKRQLMTANAGIGIPIYFDNTNSAAQPNQPIKPGQPLQPIAVVGNTASLQAPGFLPAWSQNLPIVGTLITNLPLQSLSNMLGGLNLPNMGNLGQLGNLANLGNLGQLGTLPNLGGSRPGSIGGSAPQSCPLTQKLSCRCEPLLSLPVREKELQLVQILKQNARHNEDGSRELRLVISGGHVLYQRTDKADVKQQGYYSLPFQTGQYLNIHYSINRTSYTIQADVSSSPPSSDFDAWSGA